MPFTLLTMHNSTRPYLESFAQNLQVGTKLSCLRFQTRGVL